MDALVSLNPATSEVVGEIPFSTKEHIKAAVSAAKKAAVSWGELPVKERVSHLSKLYSECEKHIDELANLASREMGMPISFAKTADMGDGLSYFKWYLENAEKYLSPMVTYEDPSTHHTVFFEPYGVAAVIVPWNWPFCNWVWGVIPHLVAGNTVVFKHAEECPLVGKLLEDIVKSVGLPEGVFTELYGGAEVGSELVDQPIDILSFTGSTAVGKLLYETAAKKFIKVLLELGGSAPGVVLSDVDPKKIAESIYLQRFSNCGQTCDGLKRLIVHKSVAEKVVDHLKEKLDTVNVGEPLDPATEIGPVVSKKQLETLEDQVKDAVGKGAVVVCGGKAHTQLRGFFFEPTILTGVAPHMRVWKEEVFGPVLPVVTFSTEEEAIELANDTPYGLGAYIYTHETKKAQRLARQIQSGMVSINGANYVMACNPFGGYKASGQGREHGEFGLREVCQLKVVATQK